jgi:predicted helicase
MTLCHGSTIAIPKAQIIKVGGIITNPNDWAREYKKYRYILGLLLSDINVSVQTIDIVKSLPKVKFK